MSQIDVQRAKESLRDAKDDLEKLDQLSNQFRTCMVIVAAPPSGSLSGDPEIKIFMEQQKSRLSYRRLVFAKKPTCGGGAVTPIRPARPRRWWRVRGRPPVECCQA